MAPKLVFRWVVSVLLKCAKLEVPERMGTRFTWSSPVFVDCWDLRLDMSYCRGKGGIGFCFGFSLKDQKAFRV